MKEPPLSNCEKAFVLKAIAEGYRLDGRNYNESRKLEISFGSDYGSCMVCLGETKVFSQVSCEVVQPKQIRPNEGLLYINVDLSPMTAPHLEFNRQSDLCVYLIRLLEKCYKDSKCIDLESLCIVFEEKVWSLRVDIKVLNHAGNIIECASIATLASLAHFKRPDVTRDGDEVIIHTLSEKDPIPTVLYHYPICFNYALFDDVLVSDPTYLEESVCNSAKDEGMATGTALVIGLNQYGELCLMDLSGAAVYNPNVVHRATNYSTPKCKDIVEMIKQKVQADDKLRQKRNKINFVSTIADNHVLALSKQMLNIQLKTYNDDDEVKIENSEDNELDIDNKEWITVKKASAKSKMPSVVETQTRNGKSTWFEVSSDSDG